MKRVFCCLLMLCLFVCASAEEYPDGFLFEGGIHWNISADEAAAILGEGVQRSAEHDPEIGSIEGLWVYDAEVAGYPVIALQLVYFEDRLYSFECYFQQANVPDVQALADALSAFLGEAEVYGADAYSLADFISGHKTLYGWKKGEVTEATLTQMNDGAQYGLQILNSAVHSAIEQAYRDAGYLGD